MENSEYETIVNYLTRGEYPAGISKEQKRAIRRKVAERSANATNSNKFVAKDGVLYYVDSRPDALGARERRVIRMEEEIVTKLKLVGDTSSEIRRMEKSRRDFVGTAWLVMWKNMCQYG